jgi:hypothetical protein
VDKAIRLTSQIAMIVAAYDRIRKETAGRSIVPCLTLRISC